MTDPYAASPAKVIIDPHCVPCEGQPGKNPDEWCGLTIHTNYYKEIPKTCRTVEYTVHVENTTIAPDGIERLGLIINGQMPGPMIHASWGDMVRIHVFNDLTNNGTSIHFHGSRMNHTNDMDGVPSITQCPIQPGGKMTYEWRASQYGTSWYHSHFAIQAWEGAFGPLVVKGPHSADFDFDMGVITLQDWSHNTVDSMYAAAEDSVAGGPRIMDNGLLNGKNTWGPDGTNNQTGKRFEMDFAPGRKHLIRLVNTAIQSTFKFSLDGHKMTVIATDFTPIEPYETDVLNINIGQRYNVIIEADQPHGAYWMRSDNQNACAGTVQATDIKGIVRYIGTDGTPTSTAHGYTGECVDEKSSLIKPILQLDAFASDIDIQKAVTVAPDSNNMFRWYLSGETFTSQWNSPTLYQYLQNGTHTSTDNLIIELPNEGEWVYLIIEQEVALPHPIHLHGHDFFEIASGTGAYTKDTPLRLKNPVRRDTALLPGNGFLVIAWVVDNPGVWLAHCHIGWHTSMGMALQFAEMTSQIRSSIKEEKTINDQCANWSSYMNSSGLKMADSGV
ncbi:multicopper oxidase [Pseudovirgaria hyperparasitica]|uniref:Multicopper oxidase n=1 Tax=Pseudovirgaria hyperparasitica TaxID=470096 RepID=A0A6A6WDS0_9PEZI|nr:multicopper oxidase [Pseudovirgaria hyperparasitica]KAF2760204.1 multicopper oxidase [Pseudovirgaria hyperparasitica]